MRRLLIILGVVLLIIALVVGAYFLFFSNNPSLTVGTFGTGGDRDPGTLGTVPDTGTPIQGAGTVVAPKLLKIADGPVARGALALHTPEKTTTASTTGTTTTTSIVPAETEVRYVERVSGNIYSFKVHERTATRLSNKTLPGAQEAVWSTDGSQTFIRFLEKGSTGIEHISTYLLPVSGEGGYFLEQDLSGVASMGSSTLLLLSSGSGSVAQVAGASGTGGTTLFSSPLSALSLAFSGKGYLATTKPSSELNGYAFSVSSTGSFSRLLGPLRGLSTLSNPSGTHVLYSYVDRGKLYTQVLDTVERMSVPLPLVTLAEKCTWAATTNVVYCAVPTALPTGLPDTWHQGATSFVDRVWRIDLSTRVATLVFDPSELADQPMDIESLTTDTSSDVLIFMNRNDGSLWSYDL